LIRLAKILTYTYFINLDNYYILSQMLIPVAGGALQCQGHRLNF